MHAKSLWPCRNLFHPLTGAENSQHANHTSVVYCKIHYACIHYVTALAALTILRCIRGCCCCFCCWCNADVALAALQADLPELRQRLTSASRKGRALASKQLQLLYHTRVETEVGGSPKVCHLCMCMTGCLVSCLIHQAGTGEAASWQAAWHNQPHA